MSADPQDDTDGDKNQKDHRGNEQRALADAIDTCGKGALDAFGVAGAIDILMRIGLNGSDLVNGLVHERTAVGDTILTGTREAAYSSSKKDDRQHHQRQAREHEQRQLEAGQHEEHERADTEHEVTQRHRQARPDRGLEHGGVVGESRNHLPSARELEESRREREQVIEHPLAKIGGDPLSDPRDAVEAQVGRERHHCDDGEHGD